MGSSSREGKSTQERAKRCTATVEGKLLVAERGCQAGLGSFSTLEISREFSETWKLGVGSGKPKALATA